MTAPAYAELCVTSNFTFLTGASHPEELVTRAAELGLTAIAITDRNSVAGVVRAYSALKELARLRAETAEKAGPAIRSQRVIDPSSRQSVATGADRGEEGRAEAGGGAAPGADTPLPRLIPGARLALTDSPVDWLALPVDLAAWSRLTQLLSLGKRRAPKGECHLTEDDVRRGGQGLILIALPPDPMDTPLDPARLTRLATAFPGFCFLGAAPHYDGRDQARLDRLAQLSQAVNLPLVAVGNVLMHRAARRRPVVSRRDRRGLQQRRLRPQAEPAAAG